MKIRSAVLEILEGGWRTEKNVEYKTRIFVNFDYGSSENSYKISALIFLSAGKQKHYQQVAASDAHRLNAQYVYCVYTNCICNLIVLTAISRMLLPALRTASTALSRLNLNQMSDK